MANYVNLLVDSLKNGYRHIVYLLHRITEIPPDHYINVCTGNFIQYGPSSNSRFLSIKTTKNTRFFPQNIDYSFKVYLRDGIFPLAYMNKKMGFYYHNEIDRILLKYYEWMLDYSKKKDENRLKRLISEEIEKTENLIEKRNLWDVKSLDEKESEFEVKCQDFMMESDEEMSVVVEIEVEDWGFEDFNEEFFKKKMKKKKKRKRKRSVIKKEEAEFFINIG